MKKILLAFLAAGVLTVPVFAESSKEGGDKPAAAQEGAGPCKQDAEKLCPGMHPGDGKFGPCMKEHKDDLSDACRAKMKEKMQAKGDECKDEFAKLCPDMKPGDGKLGPCLKKHKDEVSKGCKRLMRMTARRRGKKGGEGGDDAAEPKDDGKPSAGDKAPQKPAEGEDDGE